MATSEAYITIHDQDLVLRCEESGQFDQVSHTYLFVGPRPVDRLPSDLKVIVCRDHQPNIEDWPQFYDFTGWWVLTNHRLISADNLICLQYDMEIIVPHFRLAVEEQLADHAMVAFNAGYYGPNWMLLLPEFERTYRAGMATRGVNPDDFLPFNEWPCTQGTAWRRQTFEEFLWWMTPMFDVFKDHTFAGHLAERTVKAYLAANGIENGYMLGAIAHAAWDCHGTGALMAGRRAVYEERAASFGR